MKYNSKYNAKVKNFSLSRSIQEGIAKKCPYCSNRLRCTNIMKIKGKFKGREFVCQDCKSSYQFILHKKEFLLTYARYRMPGYEVFAYYKHPSFSPQISSKLHILPSSISNKIYTTYNYASEIFIGIELDFPLTKAEIEEKISLFTTFS